MLSRDRLNIGRTSHCLFGQTQYINRQGGTGGYVPSWNIFTGAIFNVGRFMSPVQEMKDYWGKRIFFGSLPQQTGGLTTENLRQGLAFEYINSKMCRPRGSILSAGRSLNVSVF